MRTQMGPDDIGVPVGPRRHDLASERSPSKKFPAEAQAYAVTDGRDAVGTVERRGGYFVAIDGDGRIIGRYHDLKVAVRALPGRST